MARNNRAEKVLIDFILEPKLNKKAFKKEMKEAEIAMLKAQHKMNKNTSDINTRAYVNRLNEFKRFKKAEADYELKSTKSTEQKKDNIRKKFLTKAASRFKRAMSTLTAYASAGMLLFGAINAIKTMVMELLELDKAMARVAVITGTTKKELDGLKTTIYNVASSFGVAVKDVTSFTVEMSKLGKTSDEIEGLASQSAALAMILGEDMVTSGKLMVTTMNQFNLSTIEASRVAGTFFKTIKSSPLAVKDMQTTMQYIGSAAHAAGLSIEEVGASMALLSSKGLKASKIGTGVRNVILKLSADGRAFSEVMEEMAEKGITLTEALEKFDKRGAVAGFTLINNWNTVKDAIEEATSSTHLLYEAMRSGDNKLDMFARGLNRLKGFFAEVFTGVKLERTIEDDLWDVRSALVAMNLEIPDLIKKLDELGDQEITAESVIGMLSDPKAIEEATKKLEEGGMYIDDFANVMRNHLIPALKDVQSYSLKEKSITDIIKKESDKVLSLSVQLKDDIIKGNKNIEQAKKAADGYAKDYRDVIAELINPFTQKKFTEKELDDMVSKVTSDAYNAFVGAVKNFNINDAKKEVNKLTNDLKELKTQWENGTIEALGIDGYERKLADLEEKKEIYCSLLKGTVFEGLCSKESTKDFISALLKELNENKDDLLREIDGFYDIWGAEMRTLSQTRSGEMKGMLTKKEFLENLVDEDTPPEEALQSYKDYVRNFIDMVNKIIKDEAELKRGKVSGEAVEKVGVLKDSNIQLEELIKKAEAAGADSKVIEKLKGQVEDNNNKMEQILIDEKKMLTLINKAEEDAIKSGEDKADKTDLLTATIPEKDEMKEKLKMYANFLGEILDTYMMWADEMSSQENARYKREKENVANRYSFERDVLKDASDHNLITAEQYAQKSKQLELKKIDDTNAIAKKQFEANKKADIRNAALEGTANAAKALAVTTGEAGVLGIPPGIAAAALVAAQTAIAVSAISQRQYSPLRFAEGGKVEGRSHAQGGVPFTVQGQGGYEMEGGEYIIKKSSVNYNTLPLLEAINNDRRYNPTHFANGGQIEKPDVKSDEPMIVRAYVTEKDLDAYERNKLVRTSNKNLF